MKLCEVRVKANPSGVFCLKPLCFGARACGYQGGQQVFPSSLVMSYAPAVQLLIDLSMEITSF